jgi:serine/threonine protein kinase
MGYKPQPEIEPEYDPEESEESDVDSGSLPSSATGGLIGQTLANRYRFEELLGEGTFARVFRVYDRHRRVNLAAKVLRSDIAQEPAFLERFRREATVLARLQHPHIVRYYDILEVEGQVFILTDYIAGETLQNRLRQLDGPMSPLDSLAYIEPLAAALHFAHRENVIHRDLKPANILIDENDNVYITDFGIARILSDTSTLTVDTTVGTPHYMSPEQIMVAEITPATDIYALGVMLYQMHTGRLPFMGDSDEATGATTAMRIVYEHLHVSPIPPRSLNPNLSKAIEDVILRCLEKDPAQRYRSISDVYDALTGAIGAPSVSLDAAAVAAAIASDESPVAEHVPTGVGGISQVMPEEDLDWEQKPKRKLKPSEQERELQSEKEREKEQASEEKSEEKQREKGWDVNVEKHEFFVDLGPSDRLSQFTWGSMVLWAGIVFLLNSTDAAGDVFSDPWAWIFSGAGVLLLVEVVARFLIPEFRSRPGIRLVLGVILLMVGLGVGFSFASLWPLILIVIGISILINHLSS